MAFLSLKILSRLVKNNKIRLYLEGQKQWLDIIINSKISNPIWFHCASLGEFELAVPIIEKFKEKNFKIAVSFFSSSGYEKRKNHPLIDVCFYLPIDTKKNIQTLLENLKPQKLVLVKYEFWLQLLNFVKKKQIDTFVICSTFSENHFIFKNYAFAWRAILKQIKTIFVNNTESQIILNKKGFYNVILSGDARFDRVSQIANQHYENHDLEHFCRDKKVIIWGSCWEKELEIFYQYYKKNPQTYKHILAPHNVTEEYIQNIKNFFLKGFDYQTFTEYDRKNNSNILVLNTIGHLANAYKYGHLAVVGGGYINELHNILEPLSHGLPVIFGNVFSKYPEAKMSIEKNVAFSINFIFDFENTLNFIESKYNKQKQLNFIEENKGASEMIFSVLSSLKNI